MSQIIKTERLILRPWTEDDFAPYSVMNSDPRVMEFFPSLLTKDQSNESAQLLKKEIEENGWGLWAVSAPQMADFIGFIGLRPIKFEAHFTPAIEIGWRLDFNHWNHGYATEGAKAALQFGFETLKLQEIVSITTVKNARSRHVMEKLGMHSKSEDNFDHPKIPLENPVRPHVLYRIKSEEYLNNA